VTPLAAILLVVIGRHYGWQLAPADNAADFWNIGASVSILGLAAHAWLRERRRDAGVMLAILGAHEVAVIAASLAWIVEPWPVPEGAAMLSSWAGFDLAKLGGLVVLLGIVAILKPVSSDR
jgi:hypothetical protein